MHLLCAAPKKINRKKFDFRAYFGRKNEFFALPRFLETEVRAGVQHLTRFSLPAFFQQTRRNVGKAKKKRNAKMNHQKSAEYGFFFFPFFFYISSCLLQQPICSGTLIARTVKNENDFSVSSTSSFLFFSSFLTFPFLRKTLKKVIKSPKLGSFG